MKQWFSKHFRYIKLHSKPDMATRARSPDSEHAKACQAKYGGPRTAVKHCNRCAWLKHRHEWQRRFSWLCESPAPQPWGVGCSICCKLVGSGLCSPWVVCSKGQRGKLQVIEMQRHAESDLHVRTQCKDVETPLASVRVNTQNHDHDVPSAAQVRLAVEVCNCTFGAQASEFERRSQLAARGDCQNFPQEYNKKYVHTRILRCLAHALWGAQSLRLCGRSMVCSHA